MYLIKQVLGTSNKDALQALAFSLMIKYSFVSSTFKDATITNLMSFFHLKHSTADKALNNALKLGFVHFSKRTKKNGKVVRDLIANKFDKNGWQCVEFRVINTEHGRRIYIHANNDKVINKELEADGLQSINEVEDLLMLSMLLFLIKGYSKWFDLQLLQACQQKYGKAGLKMFHNATSWTKYRSLLRNRQKELKDGEINALNCGYSIDKMVQSLGQLFSRYKVESLLKFAYERRLFYKIKNHVRFNQRGYFRRKYDVKDIPSMSKNGTPSDLFIEAYKPVYQLQNAKIDRYRERFDATNYDDCPFDNLRKQRGCTPDKHSKYHFIMPMAHTYCLQASAFNKNGRKSKTTKRARIQKLQPVQVWSSAKEIKALPF